MREASMLSGLVERAGVGDQERLQGAWVSVVGHREAELLIAGDLFAIHFLDGDIYIGTYDLDSAEQPRRMDMRIDEGPLAHVGKVALGIYELDDDVLTWCPSKPGSADRLSEFPPSEDPHHLCITFRRRQPTRRGPMPLMEMQFQEE
jgi:uncharacterized protein (TIGR03067 family)